MGQILKLPNAALDESELLAQILDEVPAPPAGLIATKEERRARYARLARDCEARRARAGFKVVS
ncbi:hypothetical protein MAL1_00243 [Bacteriophage DSS3_MAL1]|nr:hypothetical protein MAL1_00243 [Bacteriophage DSS3_MAL1]